MDVPRHFEERPFEIQSEWKSMMMVDLHWLIECIAMSVMINESVAIRCSIYGV